MFVHVGDVLYSCTSHQSLFYIRYLSISTRWRDNEDGNGPPVTAVLKQRGSDGELHPCRYISHRLSDTEHQVYDHELLAMKKAFKTWRHLLKGLPHTIIIHCDHKNLSYYEHPQKMTARQSRCGKRYPSLISS